VVQVIVVDGPEEAVGTFAAAAAVTSAEMEEVDDTYAALVVGMCLGAAVEIAAVEEEEDVEMVGAAVFVVMNLVEVVDTDERIVVNPL